VLGVEATDELLLAATALRGWGVPEEHALAMNGRLDRTMCDAILSLYRSATPNVFADWGTTTGTALAVVRRSGQRVFHERLTRCRRLPDPGQVVPHVGGVVDAGHVHHPTAQRNRPGCGDPGGQQRTPVVTDEVDRAVQLLQGAGRPVGVELLRRSGPVRQRGAEAGQGQRDAVAAEQGTQFVAACSAMTRNAQTELAATYRTKNCPAAIDELLDPLTAAERSGLAETGTGSPRTSGRQGYVPLDGNALDLPAGLHEGR
jgi:hypothetical protein